jgi:hypothetical protein
VSLNLFNFLLLSFSGLLKHHTKRHVINLGHLGIVVLSNYTTGKNQFEVELLSNVSHVNNTVTLKFLGTVAYGSHIGCVIVESTVGLLNNKRHFVLGDEDADSTIVFNSNLTF